jgi:hypothetical protein
VCNAECNADIEEALVRELDAARAAGRWADVVKSGTKLEEHRRAILAAPVVTIEDGARAMRGRR